MTCRILADFRVTVCLINSKLIFKTLDESQNNIIKCTSKYESTNLKLEGIGTVETINNNNLVLKSVICAEALTNNLLSLKKLADKDFDISD